ncbi:MAG: ribosome-associated translation inhibitor RaiA [Planctomycetota bacterium]
MNISVTGRQLEITESIRGQVQRRADKLPHFWDRVRDLDAILEKRGSHTYRAELVVHADGADPFVASVKHDDLYAAIDEAATKLERQVRNHHAKLVDHKHA